MNTALTSTTAPGKTFSSRAELADHYKSDWHKYNLKRREAGLPLLEEADFKARWEAALALRKDKEGKSNQGTDHIKGSKKKKNKKKHAASHTDPTDSETPKAQKKTVESQENPDIEPKQCLFDSHVSENLKQNVDYMQKKYGFFIPDQECLIDLEGLLGYCQEKIKLGHYCLFCEKMFPTWQGCQKHMISKQHTKLRYEQGYWEELDIFYDFKSDNASFLDHTSGGNNESENQVVEDAMDEDDEDGWEDISQDEGGDQEDADFFEGYEKEIARFGLDVTPLGELVFPDGRIVGHRALRRYYKQRARPLSSSTAIVAAKRAAGERMYEGRVVNINQPLMQDTLKGAGKGILVPLKDGVEGFSALSLYRYRAAVRKQHRDEDKARRIKYKSTQNINRMDKKANRLMNGVSVAHAKR